jgi:hypothetical protein
MRHRNQTLLIAVIFAAGVFRCQPAWAEGGVINNVQPLPLSENQQLKKPLGNFDTTLLRPYPHIVDDGPIVDTHEPSLRSSYEIPIGPASSNGRIPEGGIPLRNSTPPLVPDKSSPLQTRILNVAPSNKPVRPARSLPLLREGELGRQYAAEQARAVRRIPQKVFHQGYIGGFGPLNLYSPPTKKH